ncbi:MAG TPA: hypothetical protein VIR27_10055 [Mycobacteriales bacterium]|jgi:hypothetical protein
MSTTEHTEACTRFTATLLAIHHAVARSPDDPVLRCACGRPAVLCEINSAARDTGLLTPLTGPTITECAVNNADGEFRAPER